MVFGKAPLSAERIDELVRAAKDWAMAHGLCMRLPERNQESDIAQIAPFSLLPSEFPRQLFQQALDVRRDIALVYHRLAHDQDFITSVHESVIKTDHFTRNLMEIYQAVLDEGLAQNISLDVQRADYMTHRCNTGSDEKMELKQVEVNNIAASFAGLDVKVNALHENLLKIMGVGADEVRFHIEPNNAPVTIAEGIVAAHKYYNKPGSVILFMVEQGSQNIFDQLAIEYSVIERTEYLARVRRLRLMDASDMLELTADKRLRFRDTNDEVSVVYWRVGYVPADYPSQREWDVRRLIERSRAIKCPWIGFHLAGTKKVQQVLTQPGMVEKYLSDPDACRRIRETFVAIYGLEDNPEGHKALAKGVKQPDKYVLKPQLEGGGNNIYGPEIATRLTEMTWEERGAFILMERINPEVHTAYLVRAAHPQPAPVLPTRCVSELGTYGFILGGFAANTDQKEVEPKQKMKKTERKGDHFEGEIVVDSKFDGYLLRTKSWESNEGGVMAGASVLNTPYL